MSTKKNDGPSVASGAVRSTEPKDDGKTGDKPKDPADGGGAEKPDGDAEQAKPKAAQAAKPKPPYAVARGKAVTSKRGILSEGDEITERDLSGGQASLDELVKAGAVVKS